MDDNSRVTPPPKGPPATTKVTPYKNSGTSTHSEFLEGSLRAHLAPSLLADLRKSQDITVDQFLTGLLGFVREKGESPEPQQSAASGPNLPGGSLPGLISSVGVQVANLFCQVAGNKPSIAAASHTPCSTGKGYGYGLLQEFCAAGNETERYPIFCKIVNSILARTKTKEVEGFLKSNDLDILLQNTSSFEVKIYHQGQESTRKPDCTFLPSAIAMVPTSTLNNTVWNTIVDRLAGQSLTTRIMHMEWDMHLGVVEKKTGSSIKTCKVPTSYKGNQLVDKQMHGKIVDTAEVRFDPSSSAYPSRTHLSLQQAAVESGSKRKRLDLEGQDESEDADAHKAKRVNTGDASRVHNKQPETIPEVQFAGYNAEILYAPKVIRQHTIGVLNEDKYVHLWWFDHQGPVRSSPLNFIDVLPRFVVFLWILQRLTREGWGYVPIMNAAPDGNAETRLIASEEGAEVGQDANVKGKAKAKRPPPAPVEIKCMDGIYYTDDAYVRKHHIWGLNGRGTCVREMKRHSDPMVPVAVKVAWQELSSTAEMEIFEHLSPDAKDDPMIKGHIPELFCEETFAEYSTGTFRMQAGISSGTEGTGYRVLRITVYSLLDGCITDLGGDDFWKILLQCFDCHCKLWLSGIHHRDISAFNLMYKRSPDDEIIRVLNEFDSAIISGRQSSNTERTGTMPYMALDVLRSITDSSPQQHLYRYDVESFLWVAIWVCGTFEHGKERENPPFKDWTQGDAKHCRAMKLDFFTGKDSPWPGDHTAKAKILRGMRIHLWEEEVERVKQAQRIEEAGGEVESEVPENPKTIYEGINTKLFSVLRGQLGMNVD